MPFLEDVKMNYKEKLEDIRWKRRRDEILDLDHHKCRLCGCRDSILNVHHVRYHKGKEPWQYSSTELVTLCKKMSSICP